MFPNKRMESEIGSASSPMTFNGVSSHIGSVSSFRRAPSPVSYTHLRSHIKSIEEAFEIEISDDEICYMMITLYPNTYDAAVA